MFVPLTGVAGATTAFIAPQEYQLFLIIPKEKGRYQWEIYDFQEMRQMEGRKTQLCVFPLGLCWDILKEYIYRLQTVKEKLQNLCHISIHRT